MKLTIIIPIYNEEENIIPLYDRLITALEKIGSEFEIIMVNDGSRDRSEKILNDLAAAHGSYVIIIHFLRNFGQTAAIMAGIDNASGDIIIPMDGDNQNDPSDIPRLLEKLNDGYDVVSGWRKYRRDNFFSRILPSKIANLLISRIGGVKLHDYGCTLKAYKKEMLKDVKLYGEMHRFIPIYASWHGADVTEIVVKHHARQSGKSHYGASRIFSVILDLILIRFLDKHEQSPIHLFGGFGLLSFLLALCSFILMIYYKFWGGKSFIETPLPTFTVLFILMGVMAILIGFIAEMLMRTYYESQHKPPYLIKKIIN